MKVIKNKTELFIHNKHDNYLKNIILLNIPNPWNERDEAKIKDINEKNINIAEGIINFLENIENDAEENDTKNSKFARSVPESFLYDIEFCSLEEIDIEIVIKSLGNKIKNHFNDVNYEFRNRPILEILVTVVLMNNADIRFICKFI